MSAPTLLQCCDDASDTALIESNGVASEKDCQVFSSEIVVFYENGIANVITALLQSWH